MPHSKLPFSTRPAWSIWGARLCIFGGALLLFGSLLPPVLTEVNATIRASAGNNERRNSMPARAAGTTSQNPQGNSFHFAPPKGWPGQQPTLARNNQRGGTLQDRREIMAAYQAWKKAWSTADLETCMNLYSRNIHFIDIGQKSYDYNSLKEWYKSIWGGSGYNVTDWGTPRLRIQGNRALLIAKQGYGQGRSSSLSFISRYVWEKRNEKGKTRWLIVEEAFLPFNGDRGNSPQIY